MSAVFVLYRKLALKGIFDVIFIEEKIDYEIKTDATKVQERKTLFFCSSSYAQFNRYIYWRICHVHADSFLRKQTFLLYHKFILR